MLRIRNIGSIPEAHPDAGVTEGRHPPCAAATYHRGWHKYLHYFIDDHPGLFDQRWQEDKS